MPGVKPVIVFDTDFLSSFLKIGRVDMVRDFFNVDSVSIPLAVFTEVGETDLVNSLIDKDWIRIKTVKYSNESFFSAGDFDVLGAGERECMTLCKESAQHLLLINDKKARHVAINNGISVLNIAGFLFACKKSKFISNDDVSAIIDDLRIKDFFEFSKKDLEMFI